ncbi:ParA family protein [Sulfolobus tengchongensis]|uniref:ParA family protein n=1 Tax=Sulfolobus tengchongensis TaxID=207809 RepID=A0AAX4L426_9CREN
MEIIYVLGVKGGIGKTTYSLYFAKRLSFMGNKVLYLDHDYLSFGSLVLGHHDIGLVEEIENRLPALSRSLINSDNFYMLKLLSDPIDFNKIYSLGDEIMEAMEKLSDLGIQYIILDSSVGLMPDDIIVKSLEKLSLVRKSVYLSDIPSLNSTIKYSQLWRDAVNYKALAINMVPPIPEDMDEARSIAKSIYQSEKFNMVAVIPFDEKIYNYKPINNNYVYERLDSILHNLINNTNDLII